MKITDDIELKNFKDKKSKFKIFSELKKIINSKKCCYRLFKNTYKYLYNRKKTIKNIKNIKNKFNWYGWFSFGNSFNL